MRNRLRFDVQALLCTACISVLSSVTMAEVEKSSADAFPLDVFTTFWREQGHTMEFYQSAEYQDWVANIPSAIGCEPDASTLGNGLSPVWQLSASCDATVGWRGVLQADLFEKAGVLGVTGEYARESAVLARTRTP